MIIGLDLAAAAGVDKACPILMLVVILIMMIMIMEFLMILRGPKEYVYGKFWVNWSDQTIKKLYVRVRWVGGMVVVLGEYNKSLSDSIRIG